jgi:hypothetical protein
VYGLELVHCRVVGLCPWFVNVNVAGVVVAADSDRNMEAYWAYYEKQNAHAT